MPPGGSAAAGAFRRLELIGRTLARHRFGVGAHFRRPSGEHHEIHSARAPRRTRDRRKVAARARNRGSDGGDPGAVASDTGSRRFKIACDSYRSWVKSRRSRVATTQRRNDSLRNRVRRDAAPRRIVPNSKGTVPVPKDADPATARVAAKSERVEAKSQPVEAILDGTDPRFLRYGRDFGWFGSDFGSRHGTNGAAQRTTRLLRYPCEDRAYPASTWGVERVAKWELGRRIMTEGARFR